MKKSLIYAMTFAAVLPVLTNCSKDEMKTDLASPVITATIEGGEETKTSLTSGLKTSWTAADAIKVFSGTDGTTVSNYATTAGGESSASFAYSSGSALGAAPYYAVYPYSDAATFTSGTTPYISFVIPKIQSYKENSFAEGQCPMVAYGNTETLNFKNVCGIYKISLTGSVTIQKLTLSATDKISGNAKVAMDYSGAPVSVTMLDDSCYDIRLDCETGVALTSTPTAFYFIVPAGNHIFTLGIEATDSEGKAVAMYKSSPSAGVAVQRSHIKPMASFAFTASTDYGYPVAGVMTAGTTILTSTWAPVNCGYEAAVGAYKGYPYGRLYQWGCRYGEGYDTASDASEPVPLNAQVTKVEGNSFAKKNNFFYGFDNWCSEAVSSWEHQYDPCPAGWRVPTIDEMTALAGGASPAAAASDGTVLGFYLDGTSAPSSFSSPVVFLPAGGSNDGKNDLVKYRGEYGFYWTDTAASSDFNGHKAADGAYRYRLFGGYSSPYIAGTYDAKEATRSNGMSVRCVKN